MQNNFGKYSRVNTNWLFFCYFYISKKPNANQTTHNNTRNAFAA